MTDLHDLLDVASRPTSGQGWSATHDLATELRLGRRALNRRRVATAGGGIAAALALGGIVGGAALLSGPAGLVSPAGGPSSGVWPTTSAAAMPTPSASVTAPPTVPLTNTATAAGPFRFARTPSGWIAGPSNDYAGHLVPVTGGVSSDPSSFTGKITATVDDRPGQHSTVYNEPDGIWLAERPALVGGRQVTLSVQIPMSAGLTGEQVDRLVDGVTAGPDVENLLD